MQVLREKLEKEKKSLYLALPYQEQARDETL